MTYTYSSNDFSKKELKELKKKSKDGDAESQYLLADYYEDGLVIDHKVMLQPNAKKAFKLTKLAYENGNSAALIRYANYLAVGEVCEKNQRLAIKLYQQAIADKDSLGAVNLASLYSRNGNYKKAFEHYVLGEQLGYHCSFELGLSYYYGLGTPQDITKAIKHFKKILNEEYSYSEYEVEETNFIMGKLYLEGIHVAKSISKAIIHLKLANRENDHRSAQDLLFMLQETH